jgi:nicotinamide riboside kinase
LAALGALGDVNAMNAMNTNAAGSDIRSGAALRIAIVGAESTGKTTLAADLSQALRELPQPPHLRVANVPEVLRGWCDRNGRTPLAHEQAAIVRAQHALIEDAAATHDMVVCDTTALMTAVYSHFLFNDDSLNQRAVELHGRTDLTLLMALDLPWAPDGLQRDGPQVRAPVDTLLRGLLNSAALPFVVVGGDGPSRLANALAAVQPLLALQPLGAPVSSESRHGLFNRPSAGRWSCSCCQAQKS